MVLRAGGGVMFANDFVIFDEAHEMPDVASDHLGLSLSSWAIESALNRLHNPRKGKDSLVKKDDLVIWSRLIMPQLLWVIFFSIYIWEF